MDGGTDWLLKRPFGFAGRGRRKIRAATEADRAWIEASLRSGEGILVEPWVERELDAGLHGYVFSDGSVQLGRPTVQQIAPDGSWRATSIAAGQLTALEEERLIAEARNTASALHGAGYFGPFGIDAFRYRTSDGVAFQPRSEINARYSMGWAIGMSGFVPPDGEP
jgi:hypothetical protein